MTKKSASIFILASAALFSLNASAQQPSCKHDNNKENRMECKAERKCPMNAPGLFEGITLSDAQKQKIEQLKSDCKAKHEAKKAEAKAQKQADRKAKMGKRSEMRRQYLQEMKSILSPEQYVQFLENMVVNQSAPRQGMGPRHGNMKKSDCKGHGHKPDGKKKDLKKESKK